MKIWIQGLAAAAIGGAASGGLQGLQTGHVNMATAVSAGVGALAMVLAYLVKSPLTPPAPAVAPDNSQK